MIASSYGFCQSVIQFLLPADQNIFMTKQNLASVRDTAGIGNDIQRDVIRIRIDPRHEGKIRRNGYIPSPFIETVEQTCHQGPEIMLRRNDNPAAVILRGKVMTQGITERHNLFIVI